jgi:integrase
MDDNLEEKGCSAGQVPWNKGRLTGQKPPLKREEIWAIRIRLQIAKNVRDLALFNFAIDSKLRACDLVKIRVMDVVHGEHIISRATIMQQKTEQPVRFELTEQTRASVRAWIDEAKLSSNDYLFSSRLRGSPHISTRQYARIVKSWIALIGSNPEDYRYALASPHYRCGHYDPDIAPAFVTCDRGSGIIRCPDYLGRDDKPTLIYRRTKNLRAVQLLLGHTKLESTVRYLGIEVDDALEMAEQTEV